MKCLPIFLNQTDKLFDVILIDAFQGLNVIPFQLTTVEAVLKIYDHLNEDGIVMVNMIGSFTGKGSKFILSEVPIYQEMFQQVYLFPLQEPDNSSRRQNIILVATKNDLQPDWITGAQWGDQILTQRWMEPLAKAPVLLTDDYAPVEYFGRLGL